MVTLPQSNSAAPVPQHDLFLELLESVAFELSLGADILWGHPQAAQVKLNGELPKTLLQLTQYFDELTPRLSISLSLIHI